MVPVKSAHVTTKGRIGEAVAWLIAAIAWGISLTSQVELALEHGFHGWRNVEALGDGSLPDLTSIAMALLALDQSERGKSAWLTWILSLLSFGFMEWANVALAWPDPEAVILHSLPPFLVLSTLFVLTHTRRTNAPPPGHGPPIENPPPGPTSPPDPLVDEVTMRGLLASPAGRALSPRQLAELLGVSDEEYAARLRDEIQREGQVEAPPPPPSPPPPAPPKPRRPPLALPPPSDDRRRLTRAEVEAAVREARKDLVEQLGGVEPTDEEIAARMAERFKYPMAAGSVRRYLPASMRTGLRVVRNRRGPEQQEVEG